MRSEREKMASWEQQQLSADPELHEATCSMFYLSFSFQLYLVLVRVLNHVSNF